MKFNKCSRLCKLLTMLVATSGFAIAAEERTFLGLLSENCKETPCNVRIVGAGKDGSSYVDVDLHFPRSGQGVSIDDSIYYSPHYAGPSLKVKKIMKGVDGHHLLELSSDNIEFFNIGSDPSEIICCKPEHKYYNYYSGQCVNPCH